MNYRTGYLGDPSGGRLRLSQRSPCACLLGSCISPTDRRIGGKRKHAHKRSGTTILGSPEHTSVHKDKQTHSIPEQPIRDAAAGSEAPSRRTLPARLHYRIQQSGGWEERGILAVYGQVVKRCCTSASWRQKLGRILGACIRRHIDASTNELVILVGNAFISSERTYLHVSSSCGSSVCGFLQSTWAR